MLAWVLNLGFAGGGTPSTDVIVSDLHDVERGVVAQTAVEMGGVLEE